MVDDSLDFSMDDDEEDVEWADDLDSDEISDLLGFDLSSEEGADRSGLRALINSALVSHRRLPMLDVIFDRSARLMTTILRQVTNDNVEVHLDDVSSTRFGDFIQSLPTPSIIGVLKSAELDNYCLLSIDAELVYSIVDLLLGGRRGGGIAADDRNFTAIELALTQRVIELLAADLSKAFEPVTELTFALDRVETTPRFAAIAQDASVCSLAKFRVDVEDGGGRAAILMPHAALEPIQKSLSHEFIGEAGANEAIWRENLAEEVAKADIDLRVVLAEKQVCIQDISALTEGQTIRFNAAAKSLVSIRSGDATIATGRVGRLGGNIAVRLEEKTSHKPGRRKS